MSQIVVKDGRVVAPFTVIIDSREQAPYAFAGLRSDADAGRRPLLFRTVTRGLEAGDYSLEGFERLVAVERKSLSDLFATLGQARARFVRELVRLDAYAFAAVVVEGTWEDVLARPPARSRLNPKTVFRSVVAWQQRLPRVHWWMCPSREFAEVTTFRMLERFWKDWQAKNRGKQPPY
jgi:ERCC4-type nuclease